MSSSFPLPPKRNLFLSPTFFYPICTITFVFCFVEGKCKLINILDFINILVTEYCWQMKG